MFLQPSTESDKVTGFQIGFISFRCGTTGNGLPHLSYEKCAWLVQVFVFGIKWPDFQFQRWIKLFYQSLMVRNMVMMHPIHSIIKFKQINWKMKNEFIDKNTKYISRTGTVNGVRGNIWTIWKKVDSEWVLAGELFALKAADKSSIISAASYFYPDQRKK